MPETPLPLGPIRAAVAALGAAFIYLLIRLFGRVVSVEQASWLDVNLRVRDFYQHTAEYRMDAVIYTGFYMTERPPGCERPCVKVVFPMPEGNSTVLLRSSVDEHGNFELSSQGERFGDAGFYRLQRGRDGRVRAWRVTTLNEHFRVYLDDRQTLRCDHAVSFLGFPVLRLHYRIERKQDLT